MSFPVILTPTCLDNIAACACGYCSLCWRSERYQAFFALWATSGAKTRLLQCPPDAKREHPTPVRTPTYERTDEVNFLLKRRFRAHLYVQLQGAVP